MDWARKKNFKVNVNDIFVWRDRGFCGPKTVLITARKIIKSMRSRDKISFDWDVDGNRLEYHWLRGFTSTWSRGVDGFLSPRWKSLSIDHFLVGAIVRKVCVVKTLNWFM